jgi:hypothetical protein
MLLFCGINILYCPNLRYQANPTQSHRKHEIDCGLHCRRKFAMKNPWTKKNLLLSMWLSGANAVAGSARSRGTAALKRQARSEIAKGMKQATDFWTGALSPPAPKKKKRR